MADWSTDDLGLATFLQVQGHEILNMEWDVNECWFWFTRTEDLVDDIADYHSNLARCDPKELLLGHKRLKQTMMGSKPARTG